MGNFKQSHQKYRRRLASFKFRKQGINASLEMHKQSGTRRLSCLCGQSSVFQKSPTSVHVQVCGYIPALLNAWQPGCSPSTVSLIMLPYIRKSQTNEKSSECQPDSIFGERKMMCGNLVFKTFP